ncbi:MAG: FixH family protein [Acidobacteriota bacterium]|nr:FixH family protein [Acidobacteriota bacterium]
MFRKSALITALVLLAALTACGPRGGAKEIKSGTVGGLSVTLANGEGVLRQGQQEFTVTFRDSAGKTVDVGSASLNFYMPAMGTMPPMNSAATLKTTSTPGVYQGKADIEMAGEWQAQIAYEGPAGSGKGTLAVTAQ